ncbi:hypothetical protein LIER_28465 [Lithospermum erythrorhizon]|uniref:Uncharacterized protein n=1 Tax=Lithospermum erythrorhizon TaxID=34254 RepID=A0AAV3RJH1_LITER
MLRLALRWPDGPARNTNATSSRAVLEVSATEALLLPTRIKGGLVGSVPLSFNPPQFLVLQGKVPGIVADLRTEILQFLLHGPHLKALPGQGLL